MRHKGFFAAVFLALCLCLFSCDNGSSSDDNITSKEIEAPEEIARRAYEFAKLYEESETEYLLGGQSPVRAIQIDCSGLVVMCYKYAIVDTKYSLLFDDASSTSIAEKYCIKTESPQKGDLILMGEENSANITHIAIFEREYDEEIYFIDSTEKPTEKINGVTTRHYGKQDSRFKFYGKMKLKYN